MVGVLERLPQALGELGNEQAALTLQAPPGAQNQITLSHLAALPLGLLQDDARRAQAAPQQTRRLTESPIQALIKQRRV
jgi:hypothetical protein